MYLGLALAADGGIKKFDEFAPRLRSALAHLDSRLPPPDETAQLLSNDRTSGGAEAPVAGEGAAAGKVGDGREEEAQEAEDEIAGREASRDECSICLQPFRPSDTVKVLPCSHAFHSAPCLHRWFRRSRCCPVCREPWVEFSPVGRPLVRCLLSPVNPDIFVACRRLAAAQVERGTDPRGMQHVRARRAHLLRIPRPPGRRRRREGQRRGRGRRWRRAGRRRGGDPAHVGAESCAPRLCTRPGGARGLSRQRSVSASVLWVRCTKRAPRHEMMTS